MGDMVALKRGMDCSQGSYQQELSEKAGGATENLWSSPGGREATGRTGWKRRIQVKSVNELIEECEKLCRKAMDRKSVNKYGKEFDNPDVWGAIKAMEFQAKLMGYIGADAGKGLDLEALKKVLRANGYDIVKIEEKTDEDA